MKFQIKNVILSANFDPRDCWVGLFWDTEPIRHDAWESKIGEINQKGPTPMVFGTQIVGMLLMIHICIIPLFPISFSIPTYRLKGKPVIRARRVWINNELVYDASKPEENNTEHKTKYYPSGN